MRMIKLLLVVDLVAFAIFTLYAVLQIDSWSQLVTAFGSHAMVVQVGIDLVISLTLAALGIWLHAKSIGVNPLLYIILIPFTGSIIVMVYVLRHVLTTDSSKLKTTNNGNNGAQFAS